MQQVSAATAGQASYPLQVFGDGASSEGDAPAGMNFASTRKSQTLLLAGIMGSRSVFRIVNSMLPGIAERVVDYGMPALRVDGNDLIAVLRGT